MLSFFEKPIKAKIKHLTTKRLLLEQPFYKQPIEKSHTNISRNERPFRGYDETYKVEIINSKKFK